MLRFLFPKRGKHYKRNLIIWFSISLVIVLFVIVPVGLAYGLLHPPRHRVCCFTPADYDLDYEAITFPASDGASLSGWYIPSTNGAAIILVHANNGNRTGVFYHAQFLAAEGYGVLMFDVRGFGESEAGLFPYPPGGMGEDVIGAVGFLKTRPEVDPERIGALGLSMGANIVLRAAAQSDEIRAVVADGAGEPRSIDDIPEFRAMPALIKGYVHLMAAVSYRLVGITTPVPGPLIADTIAEIAPRPVLLISTGIASEQSDNRQFYALAGEPKTLWELPDVGHIQGLFAEANDYQSRVLAFFAPALLSD